MAKESKGLLVDVEIDGGGNVVAATWFTSIENSNGAPPIANFSSTDQGGGEF